MISVKDSLKFRGTFRSYQARVLESVDKYIEDGRLHIVAAPGSGKTTLGIEVIGRIGLNTLIFAPSVTIREQWASRICEAFLVDGIDKDELISQNLRDPKPITIATYQALHSAMRRYSGKLEEVEEDVDEDGKVIKDETDDSAVVATENVDFSGFDVVKTMKAAGVKVLCLDECHHLRSEWWKALEEFRDKMADKDMKIIALTATPPIDSTDVMWNRYINMCGPIDEEITIPELVKEKSLCPHQDFIYFNYPTKTEQAAIDQFEANAKTLLQNVMADNNLAAIIASHPALNGRIDAQKLLDNPPYLSSLLIYQKAKGGRVPAELLRLLGTNDLPGMDEEWLEYLLQGFLYDDVESYPPCEEYREALIKHIKYLGLIENKRVTLMINPKLEKELASSKGKCKSIREITLAEYSVLGKGLRELILTDFIREKEIRKVGRMSEDITDIGVIPFFEMLRRAALEEKQDIALGVLCGKVVIIPASAKEALLSLLKPEWEVTFGSVGELSEDEYVRVYAKGDSHFLTGVVTQVFTEGHMQVLIGTKSLLGEGWDSPCINSLILASFVGSFMLSNQMRGRAIRMFKGDPDKTSSIWHLVCVRPADKDGAKSTDDYKLMVRRMEHFLGLHYEKDAIESGIGRFSIVKEPFTKECTDNINKTMLAMSADRLGTRQKWERVLADYQKMETEEAISVNNRRTNDTKFKKESSGGILGSVGGAIGTVGGMILGGPIGLAVGAVSAAIGGFNVFKMRKAARYKTEAGQLQGYGDGLLKALKNLDMVENKSSKVVINSGDSSDDNYVSLYGGSQTDKQVFADCVSEMFGPVDNPRYLLYNPKGGDNMYYAVPERFGKKKEDAMSFYEAMKEYMGDYQLIYTRNEEGRKKLLEARVKTNNPKFVSQKRKQVKNALY